MDRITEFEGFGGPLAPVPDDLTIPQFMFDTVHPLSTAHVRPAAWLIDDATGREVTCDQIRYRTLCLANALRLKYHIGVDDVVAVLGPNHIDYPILLWAILRLGAVATCANPAYTVDELTYQLKLTKARILFVAGALLPTALEAAKLSGIPADRIVLFDGQLQGYSSIQDMVTYGLSQAHLYQDYRMKAGEGKTKLAFLLFSSGTTGRPKAVMIPHYAIISNMVICQQFATMSMPGQPNLDHFVPGDRSMLALPLFHVYGIVVILHWHLFSGMTLVVVPRFDFEKALRSIERYRITHLSWVPPMVVLLCKHPATKKYDLSSVKCLLTGGAPLGAELLEQARKVLPGAVVAQGYGLTETVSTTSKHSPWKKRSTPGSSGVLLTGVKARIRKADGSWGGYDEAGEIVVKAPSMALGYLDNPQATAEAFKDGWLYTGDEGYINREHEIFIVDRIKELIKVRGFQVAPAELEAHLLDHPDVADTCVVSAPDEYSGELPFAFVVLGAAARERVRGNPEEEAAVRTALFKHVRDHKANYKWLGGLALVEAVPKSASGKLLRRFLRDRLKADVESGKVQLEPPTRGKGDKAKL